MAISRFPEDQDQHQHQHQGQIRRQVFQDSRHSPHQHDPSNNPSPIPAHQRTQPRAVPNVSPRATPPASPTGSPNASPNVSPNASLERWMLQQQQATSGPWDLYFSRNFADLWYGARAAGERVRGQALEQLYRSRPIPGGPHPDPREPAAFSSGAILSVAADLLGLQLNPMLLNQATPVRDPTIDLDVETSIPLPCAWINTYTSDQRVRRPPELVLRSLHANRFLLEFEVACLLGFWHHEHDIFADPDAPPQTVFLPRTPGVVSLLHQYAIALLCLPKPCPPSWECQCNAIRARFNAPPPDHERPTTAYELSAIRRATQSRHTTDPQFPYPDQNIWQGDH